ncbi:MAG: hypothetical protein K1060chlam2_01099 [Chlamydiae bacterium]|nr:hypothetical protein [Chlamydiota bacterium]
MPRKTRTFQRPLGERRYKKLFVISAEGSKTEPQYFTLFNQPHSIVLVKCLKRKSTNSSPTQVLKRMEGYLRKESLKNAYEAWLVVDKDDWTEDQLLELSKWAKKRANYNFALSNPNFEYWLLLHFEEGKGMKQPQECSIRLKRHLRNYKKDIDGKNFTLERMKKAIPRAKRRNANRNNDLPQMWSTDVYKLVERILNHQ